MQLIRLGISLTEIAEMEVSEAKDWISAAQVLEYNDKIRSINALIIAQLSPARRNSILGKIKTEQLLLLGENPYKPSKEEIEKTRSMDFRLKSRRRREGHGQRDSRQA